MMRHVCANMRSHYSVVVQAKFPLSKVRVITSGSSPPMFPSCCHSAFHLMSTRYFLISAGCVSHVHGFAESRQGLAWHLDVICPFWEERKLCGLLHAPPSLHRVTKITTAIRQCHLEVATYQSDHSEFVLIILSFHLPLPFHTSGQANWRQLVPCPSPTLHQKPCWAVREPGSPSIGALAASPAVTTYCLSPWPRRGTCVSCSSCTCLGCVCTWGSSCAPWRSVMVELWYFWMLFFFSLENHFFSAHMFFPAWSLWSVRMCQTLHTPLAKSVLLFKCHLQGLSWAFLVSLDVYRVGLASLLGVSFQNILWNKGFDMQMEGEGLALFFFFFWGGGSLVWPQSFRKPE